MPVKKRPRRPTKKADARRVALSFSRLHWRKELGQRSLCAESGVPFGEVFRFSQWGVMLYPLTDKSITVTFKTREQACAWLEDRAIEIQSRRQRDV
jgi:hypothetical protein